MPVVGRGEATEETGEHAFVLPVQGNDVRGRYQKRKNQTVTTVRKDLKAVRGTKELCSKSFSGWKDGILKRRKKCLPNFFFLSVRFIQPCNLWLESVWGFIDSLWLKSRLSIYSFQGRVEVCT